MLGTCGEMTKPVLILTRPAPASERFAASVSAETLAKVTLIISPLLEIVPTGVCVDMAKYKGAIFTSANGIDHAMPGQGRPAYCVGARTAKMAMANGWNVPVWGQNADDLIAQLTSAPPAGPLIHIGGVHQRGDIAARLSQTGLRTDAVAVYDQKLLRLSPTATDALAAQQTSIVPLFSPRTAMHFAEHCPDMSRVVILALSEAVAASLLHCRPKKLVIAAEPSGASMRIALETAVDWVSLA